MTSSIIKPLGNDRILIYSANLFMMKNIMYQDDAILRNENAISKQWAWLLTRMRGRLVRLARMRRRLRQAHAVGVACFCAPTSVKRTMHDAIIWRKRRQNKFQLVSANSRFWMNNLNRARTRTAEINLAVKKIHHHKKYFVKSTIYFMKLKTLLSRNFCQNKCESKFL